MPAKPWLFKPKYESSSRDRWFRSPEWDPAVQAEFERKIGRARPRNRVQYRRIKAIALLESGLRDNELAGYAMLRSILSDGYAPNFEKVSVLSTLARYDQDHDDLDEAEKNYRAALSAMKHNRSGSNDEEEIGLAEILIKRGGRDNLEEARALLDARVRTPPGLMKSRFRLAVAIVRHRLAIGDAVASADWATTALTLAAATDSGFRWHPEFGLVKADARTLAWLSAVAHSRAAPNRRLAQRVFESLKRTLH